MDQPEQAGDKTNKGGRPCLVRNEKSVRIGPFRINKSMGDWIASHAAAIGVSQGAVMREALARMRRAVRRSDKPKAAA